VVAASLQCQVTAVGLAAGAAWLVPAVNTTAVLCWWHNSSVSKAAPVSNQTTLAWKQDYSQALMNTDKTADPH